MPLSSTLQNQYIPQKPGIALAGLGGVRASTAIAGHLLTGRGAEVPAGFPLAEIKGLPAGGHSDSSFHGYDMSQK